MDHFGIGQAIKGMAIVYFQSSRKTGRTMSLIESVKNGDRIVFADSWEADRVQKLCKERDIEVRCVVIDPQTPERIFEREPALGRTIFDHGWIQQYYMNAINHCEQNIDRMERQTSGYGEAHRETRRKAEEMAKWRF